TSRLQNQNGINALGLNTKGGEQDPIKELLDMLKQKLAAVQGGQGGQCSGPGQSGGQQQAANGPQQADQGSQESMPSPDDPDFDAKMKRCLAKIAATNPQLAQQINSIIPGNNGQGAGGSQGVGAVV